MNRLGDTSAFVIPAGQLLLTRRGKTRMYTVGIVFEFYTVPLKFFLSQNYTEHRWNSESLPFTVGPTGIHGIPSLAILATRFLQL